MGLAQFNYFLGMNYEDIRYKKKNPVETGFKNILYFLLLHAFSESTSNNIALLFWS